MKSEVWKLLASTLLATVLTGGASWLVFGKDKVTRSEMLEYVELSTPWVRDKGEIQSAIKANSHNIGRLEQVCDRAVAAQHQLIVEQRVLITKVDALLKNEE